MLIRKSYPGHSSGLAIKAPVSSVPLSLVLSVIRSARTQQEGRRIPSFRGTRTQSGLGSAAVGSRFRVPSETASFLARSASHGMAVQLPFMNVQALFMNVQPFRGGPPLPMAGFIGRWTIGNWKLVHSLVISAWTFDIAVRPRWFISSYQPASVFRRFALVFGRARLFWPRHF